MADNALRCKSSEPKENRDRMTFVGLKDKINGWLVVRDVVNPDHTVLDKVTAWARKPDPESEEREIGNSAELKISITLYKSLTYKTFCVTVEEPISSDPNVTLCAYYAIGYKIIRLDDNKEYSSLDRVVINDVYMLGDNIPHPLNEEQLRKSRMAQYIVAFIKGIDREGNSKLSMEFKGAANALLRPVIVEHLSSQITTE
ncbi:MAG: hypothetical protein ABR981_02030 [Candidatus Micrarchaeaceae archaeon]|jgi:hypothetical protein